jgi:hypothetical protein
MVAKVAGAAVVGSDEERRSHARCRASREQLCKLADTPIGVPQ